MNTELLITFIILNIVNVVIQTVKSLCTVKCGKGAAALVNALAYGLYTVVLVYTVCDLPLLTKAFVVALCNLVGVYIVKLIEEKSRKDKLWLVKITIPNKNVEHLKNGLSIMNIPNTQLQTNTNYTVFDCYCQSKEDTRFITSLCIKYKGKAFASENKL